MQSQPKNEKIVRNSRTYSIVHFERFVNSKTQNIVVCVNLLDEAKKKGIQIDLDSLSKILGVPVVGTIARNKKTLRNLLDTIYNVCIKKITPSPEPVTYSTIIEDCVEEVSNVLHELHSLPEHLYRWVSLKFLDGNLGILASIEKHLNIDFENSRLLKIKTPRTNKRTIVMIVLFRFLL